MTTVSSEMTWREAMTFDAEADGFPIVLDATEAAGGSGNGPRPKPLLMTALAGCTAMDVAATLRKMRLTPTKFTVRAEGDLAEEHPKRYVNARVTYTVDGDIPADKLVTAIQLSRERYCAISATLERAIPIDAELILNGERVSLKPLEKSA